MLKILRLSTVAVGLIQATRLLVPAASPSSPVWSSLLSSLDDAVCAFVLPSQRRADRPRVVFLEHEPDKPEGPAWALGALRRTLSSPDHQSQQQQQRQLTGTTRLVEPMSRSFREEERIQPPPGVQKIEWEQPRTDWHPTCNTMHEVNVADGSEAAFHFSEDTGTSRLSISVHNRESHLRMVRFTRNLSGRDFFKLTVDAAAMDRLSASPYVVSPHSICGLSILSDHMGTMLRPRVRKIDMPPLRRLEIAVQMAQAVADAHRAGIVHMDLQIKNVMMKNGVVHLNDFNLGHIPGYAQPVKGIMGYENRPPELLEGTDYVGDPQAFDVYALGNILFEIWTRRHPYEDAGDDFPDETIAARKRRGLDPPLPGKTMTQPVTDSYAALRALQEATRACFRADPRQRPSAEQIARGLDWIHRQLLLLLLLREDDPPRIVGLDVAESVKPFFGTVFGTANESVKAVS